MANNLNWIFSDSSSDEEPIQRQKKVYKTRRTSEESDFRTLYRFDRENFHTVVRIFLSDEAFDARGGGLTPAQKMKIFLRYVGDPGFQVEDFYVFTVRSSL